MYKKATPTQTTWSASGFTTIEIEWDKLEDGLQLSLVNAICETGHVELDPKKEIDGSELVIYFIISGESSPGKTHGPPEDCYPPEFNEERTLVTVTLTTDNHVLLLEDEVAEKFFDKFNKQVEKEEIDIGEEAYD